MCPVVVTLSLAEKQRAAHFLLLALLTLAAAARFKARAPRIILAIYICELLL